MKLRKYIEEKNVVLGNTPDGKSWALKALHPADPLTEVRGIPDQSAMPTVFQNYQWSTNVTNPTPGTTGIWSFDLFLFAHPILAGALRTHDSAGAYLWSPIVNPQVGLSGSTWIQRQEWFVNNVEKYRVAYLGVTGHQDAAAVTNQGMIACVQYPITSISGSLDTDDVVDQIVRLVDLFSSAPKTWTEMQTLPNAYLNTAREGVYAPYKLSRTCQDWQTSRDLRQFVPYGNCSAFAPTARRVVLGAAAPSLTTLTGGWPYGLTGYYAGSVESTEMTLKRSDEGIIHIAGINLHSSSSFTFIFRAGYELQVAPGSAVSTFAKLSPRYDSLALDGYYAIAREFKDAYPEDFNSLEKILGTIASVVGDVVGTLFPVARPVITGIKALLSPSITKVPVTQMSEGQKEDAQKVLASVPISTVQKKRKKIVKRK